MACHIHFAFTNLSYPLSFKSLTLSGKDAGSRTGRLYKRILPEQPTTSDENDLSDPDPDLMEASRLAAPDNHEARLVAINSALFEYSSKKGSGQVSSSSSTGKGQRQVSCNKCNKIWFSNKKETHFVCDTCLAASSSCPPPGLEISAAGAYYDAANASTRHSRRVKDMGDKKGTSNKNNDETTGNNRIIKNKKFGCYYKF